MPDFSRPEYASYVELCRELRLEHESKPGDWSAVGDCLAMRTQPGGADGPDEVWLPQLADWLDMLMPSLDVSEEGGPIQDFHLEYAPRTRGAFIAGGVRNGGPWDRVIAGGATPEEAAARLAIAVGAVKLPTPA